MSVYKAPHPQLRLDPRTLPEITTNEGSIPPTMSELRSKGGGRYAFGNKDDLKAFLSIDGTCLGNAANKVGCEKKLSKNKSDSIEDKLEVVNEAGFPSVDAAALLKAVAGECMCKTLLRPVHPSVVTGYGADAMSRSQEADLYAQWNRRLWVEFLRTNGVFCVYADRPPPDLVDEEAWAEQLQCLAAGLPHGDARRDGDSSSPVDLTAGSGLRAARTGSPAPGPLKRRASGLQKLFVSRARTVGRIMTVFSRSAAAAKSTGLRRAHTAAGGSTDNPPGEQPVRGGLESEEDEEFYFMDAPERVVELATPEKPRGSAGGANDGVQRLLSDELDASPGKSFLSEAPSATFSEGDGNLDQTPDTIHSYYDSISSAGKGYLSIGRSRTDQAHATQPALHTQETRTPSSEPSELFNPLRESTGRRPGPYTLLTCLDPPAQSEPAALESRPGSGQRPRRDATHEQGTSSKSRPPLAPAVSSSTDGEEKHGDEEEHSHEEDQSDDEQSDEEGQPDTTTGDADFTPFGKPGKKQYMALEKILATLEKPMQKHQRNGGYIYIFESDSAQGFLKIGQSAQPFGHRAKAFEHKCGYKAKFLREWKMDVAASAMETCVHSHLGKYRYWDRRCQKIYQEKGAKGEAGRCCDQKHKEWFKIDKERAEGVIEMWHRFIKTRPFDNGRLNSFWKNEVVLAWDKMDAWKGHHRPAFHHWDRVMGEALDRSQARGAGDPMADLPLRLRVRSESESSVLEVLNEEGLSDVPLLSIPMLSRGRRKSGALNAQASPPIDL